MQNHHHVLYSRPNEDPKYTGGVITFDLLEDRPGQGLNGSFSVDLRRFLLASAVRIRMEGHPYLPNNDEKKHTYHGIIELRVEAMYVQLENRALMSNPHPSSFKIFVILKT